MLPIVNKYVQFDIINIKINNIMGGSEYGTNTNFKSSIQTRGSKCN